MIRLRPGAATAIVVSTLVISLAIAGSRLASADTPPGDRDGRESHCVNVARAERGSGGASLVAGR